MSTRNPEQPFPEDISSGVQRRVFDIFNQIQEQVDAGNDVDLNDWNSQVADILQGGWARYKDMLMQEQPGYVLSV